MQTEIIETIKENLPILLICGGVTMGFLIVIEEIYIHYKMKKDGKK